MPHPISRRLLSAALLLSLSMPGAGALSGVSNWATDGVQAARSSGLEPAALSDASASAPITRAEFCSIAINLYRSFTDTTPVVPATSPFSDCDDKDVLAAYRLGIVSGRSGLKQGMFDPDADIQRQDLCVMLSRLLDAVDLAPPPIAGEAAIEGYPDIDRIASYATDAVLTMVDYIIVGGVTDTRTGAVSLQPEGKASREQALIMASRFLSTFEGLPRTDPAGDTDPVEDEPVVETPPILPIEQDVVRPLTTAQKMTLVYGEGGTQYETAEQAEANMVEISVKVWRLQPDGSKTTGTTYLTVNKNLASTYEAIFDEIYNGDEKFPIKNVGCYAWRTGEHSQGTAIDLNWEENMEATINADGSLTPTTGTHWTPGDDPYSIPEGGDVYNAFIKHGFSWGGNAWSRKRDYMHFSYFGR